MNISVVINTFNSDKTLSNCLESVKDFDEIVICDMYSTDNTLLIAQKFNCKIVMHEPTGYVEPARNFAISQARNEWVLVLDSDETISAELKDFVLNYSLEKNKNTDAYMLPRKNYFMNRFMHCIYPDYQLRFFKKSCVNWPHAIHSIPKVNGVLEKFPSELDVYIDHKMGEETIESFIRKMNHYTNLEVRRRQNKNYSGVSLFLNCSYRFFRMYILKRAYKDGKAGLIYALLNTFYKFTTMAKVIESKHMSDKK